MSILAIDDSPAERRVIERLMERAGFRADTAPDPDAAMDLLRERDYSLVLLDVKIPGFHCPDTVTRILEARPKTPILLMTGGASHIVIDEARARGARGPLMKPFGAEVADAVRAALADKGA